MNFQLPLMDTRGRIQGRINYGQSIMGAMFPDAADHMVVVQVPRGTVPPEEVAGYKIDMWGSSIKSGRIIYSKCDFGARWARTAEELVYVGSLLSQVRIPPQEMTARVLVVDDGERGTGDGFGLVSHKIVGRGLKHDRDLRFTRMADGYPARVPHKECEVAQFRFITDDLIMKGMVAAQDLGEYDMVLPKSCFKGKKSRRGTRVLTGWFGIVDWAIPRPCDVSYQVIQWLPWDVVYADILPNAVIEAGYMRDAETSTDHIKGWLGLQAEDEARMALEFLLKADELGIMISHPWVQTQIHRLMRLRWLELATAGGFGGMGLKAVPDDSLAIDEVRCGDMPLGDLVMFRYPLLNWTGIRVVRNMGTSEYGCIAMSHEAARIHQGDFDGDAFVVWEADTTPNVKRVVAMRQVDRAPTELHKERLETPLEERAQVAHRIMVNTQAIGRIANLITRANAAGLPDSLIFKLGDQLQYAIDSVKWNVAVDLELLSKLSKDVPKLDWLSWRYFPDVFNKKVPATKGNDTVSRLWNEIRAWYKVPTRDVSEWQAFKPLVPEVKNQALLNMVAYMTQKLYTGPVAAAMRNQTRADREFATDQACRQFRQWAEGVTVKYQGKTYGGLIEERQEDVFRALWHLSHSKGIAAVFVAFMPKVISAVKSVTITGSASRPVVKAKGVTIPTLESKALLEPIGGKYAATRNA